MIIEKYYKPNLVISCNRWLKENHINHFSDSVWILNYSALNEFSEVWLDPMCFRHYPSYLCAKYLRKLSIAENRRSYFCKKDF